jgi:hypothetical protein
MIIASRTPEGEFNRCEICGHDLNLEPSRPPGDAPCPNCGSLVWFAPRSPSAPTKSASQAYGELLPQVGDPIVLESTPLVVGRGFSCDIRLSASKISLLHCVLTCSKGYWKLRDLGSTNGTTVNGVRVNETVLRPRDKISLGGTHLEIMYSLSDGAASLTS